MPSSAPYARYNALNLLLLLALLGFSPTAAEASIISPITVEYSSSTAPLIAQAYAYRNGADFDDLWRTIECENPLLDPALQSYYKRAGGPNGRENSWGLAQIHLPDHPDVTRAQAQDPFFSLDWMSKEFAAGRESQWTCWRRQHSK